MEFPDDTGMHHHTVSCKNDKQATLSLLQALSSVSFPVKPWDGKGSIPSVNTNTQERKKKSISREVPSTVHSFSPSPSKCLSYFPWHKHLDFSKSWCQGFSWRKSCIYWAGREGGLPQHHSQCALCAALLLRPGPCKNFESLQKLSRGEGTQTFSFPGLFFHSWLISKAQKQHSFPSGVVTQGHLLFNIPTTNEKRGGGTAGNINKP